VTEDEADAVEDQTDTVEDEADVLFDDESVDDTDVVDDIDDPFAQLTRTRPTLVPPRMRVGREQTTLR